MAQITAVRKDCVAEKATRPAAKPLDDNNANRAVPFWEEDFANGFPAGWTTIDSSGICPWVYSTDGSWGNFRTGVTTAAAPAISSTTSANGFLLCDIDSANHFTYGQPSGTNGSFVYRGGTPYQVLTNADLGQIITLEMNVPADVFADEEILVVAGHSGGAATGDDDVSFMYGQTVAERDVYGFNGAGDLFFLSSPRAIVIRPDFDCGLGLAEADEIIDATLFPNPANDQFTVRLAKEISTGTITLVDVSGRIVYLNEINSTVSDITVDVAKFANGMYTMHIQSDNGVNSIQVEVAH